MQSIALYSRSLHYWLLKNEVGQFPYCMWRAPYIHVKVFVFYIKQTPSQCVFSILKTSCPPWISFSFSFFWYKKFGEIFPKNRKISWIYTWKIIPKSSHFLCRHDNKIVRGKQDWLPRKLNTYTRLHINQNPSSKKHQGIELMMASNTLNIALWMLEV
jgi:hypothetical protein